MNINLSIKINLKSKLSFHRKGRSDLLMQQSQSLGKELLKGKLKLKRLREVAISNKQPAKVKLFGMKLKPKLNALRKNIFFGRNA